MGSKCVKVVKLKASGLKARILVSDKDEVAYMSGLLQSDSEHGHKLQVIYYYCENYLQDIIPYLVGKPKADRKQLFDELYSIILAYNPGVTRVCSPTNGGDSNSTGGIVFSFIGTPGTKTKTETKKKTHLAAITKAKVRGMASQVKKKVIGQDDVIDKIQECFERSIVGISEEDRPKGSFIFVGDTGTGKTLTVKEVAKYFWGDKWRTGLYVINGSEMMEEHEAARLLGSPQGYVGYEDGSPFLKHMAENPETIVLFDEFEKANPRIQDVFLQILDDGFCNDNKGNRVDFTKSFIVFTSNIGTKEVYHKPSVGFATSDKKECVATYVDSALFKFCRVEFIKRFDEVIVFNTLSSEQYVSIAKLEVTGLIERLKSKSITLRVSKGVYLYLAKTMELGDTARDLKGLVRSEIEAKIAKLLITDDDFNALEVFLDGEKIGVKGVKVDSKEEGCE